jgi:hypothetical protein
MPALDPLPAFTGRAVPAAATTPNTNTNSSSSTSTRNPLQAKVTRLLSANLEDGATRAALDTLGQVELAESKRARRTAAAFSDPTTTTTTAGGPGGAGISDALRRGGLRKEVDARMEQGGREFLRAFSEVNDASPPLLFCGNVFELTTPSFRQKLSMLQSHLDAMNVCCDEVQAELDRANSGTKYLLEHAQGLREQRSADPRSVCGATRASKRWLTVLVVACRQKKKQNHRRDSAIPRARLSRPLHPHRRRTARALFARRARRARTLCRDGQDGADSCRLQGSAEREKAPRPGKSSLRASSLVGRAPKTFD